MYVDVLEHEKRIYERLGGAPGIARYVGQSRNGMQLEYYPNGALSDYMASHKAPCLPWRWELILQATGAIAQCHERSVLVFDIALRNFVLADDLSLRLIDFGQSAFTPGRRRPPGSQRARRVDACRPLPPLQRRLLHHHLAAFRSVV